MRAAALVLLSICTSGCASQSLAPLQSGKSASSTVPQEQKDMRDAVTLAEIWIEYWNEGTPRALPLSNQFVHVSPFGRIEGRQRYLDTVIPMSNHKVSRLNVNRVIGSSNQAVIWFDMHTPRGVTPVCDWVIVENDEIVEIHSFYDPSNVRYK